LKTTPLDRERAEMFRQLVPHYSQSLILCVLRHHPQSMNDDRVMETLLMGIDEAEWREKDRQLKEALDETPEFECPICWGEFSVTDMYTVNCAASHRYCFDCMRQEVKTRLASNNSPGCPGDDCEHTLNAVELEQICGKESTEVQKFNGMLLRTALTSMSGSVRCPTPGCANWMVVDDALQKVRVVCSSCDAVFCSMCKDPYHYGDMTCNEAKEKAMQYMHWQAQQRTSNAGSEIARKLEERSAEIAARIRELEADEEWKVQHCKMCPKCKRVIEKVAGCDSVLCGRNYHGGDVQDGCGNTFNWGTAPKYTKKDVSHLTTINIREEVAKAVGTQVDHGEFRCDGCHGEIVGLRFACICCPCYNLCEKCEPDPSTHGTHPESHSFDIIGLPPLPKPDTPVTPPPAQRSSSRSLFGFFTRSNSKN
jgi:IBR domain, a half RING-finger domain/Zinc finger, ZZ type